MRDLPMTIAFSYAKIIGFILCLSLIVNAKSFAAEKVFANKSASMVKSSIIISPEILKGDISQSEENRNNKIFQVAKIVIKASPEKVFKTFTDYDQAPKIFSYLKKSKIMTVDGPRKTICCEADLAGGLFKFEYVLEFIEHAPTLVEWHRLSGAFKINEGYWKFEPIDNGKATLVTYSKYIDGGFLFPQFLVKKELRSNMPVILNELKRSVEQVSD